MRSKFPAYAITISFVVHLCAVILIGRTSAARLSAASPTLAPRYIKVDLINLPAKYAPKASEAPVVSLPTPLPPPPTRTATPGHGAYPGLQTGAPAKPGSNTETLRPDTTGRVSASSPGSNLNIGSTSPDGDLSGDWEGGKTPVGWVPSSDDGAGKGSGPVSYTHL
ncbi:MAG: hypothetical protein N3B12_07915, partial [Armatimonadetes bacterium]|nr:hypothetical protein [Armatimonadota bacterium]